jgi:thiol-disulfide isomerase/thioredoxin
MIHCATPPPSRTQSATSRPCGAVAAAVAVCGVILAIHAGRTAVAEPAATTPATTFGIGSPAPSIDVTDWIHPGSVRPVQPFNAFAPGTIYVIEFWATWCEHSRAAFPLLAKLQRTHPRDVAIITIGLDLPEDVRGFLSDSDPDVRELAAEAGMCCIVADVDGSVQESYMDAVLEAEVPAAFIVGRDGRVEWIGHPLEIEEPLERIVAGSWDRVAFAAAWKQQQLPRQLVHRVLLLIGEEKVDEAVEEIDRVIADDKTTVSTLNEIAWTLVLKSVYGPLPGAVMQAAERAATKCVEHDPTDANALDTLAHVLAVRGRLDAAIATQRRAVEHGGADAGTFKKYLRQLEAGRR